MQRFGWLKVRADMFGLSYSLWATLLVVAIIHAKDATISPSPATYLSTIKTRQVFLDNLVPVRGLLENMNIHLEALDIFKLQHFEIISVKRSPLLDRCANLTMRNVVWSDDEDLLSDENMIKATTSRIGTLLEQLPYATPRTFELNASWYSTTTSTKCADFDIHKHAAYVRGSTKALREDLADLSAFLSITFRLHRMLEDLDRLVPLLEDSLLHLEPTVFDKWTLSTKRDPRENTIIRVQLFSQQLGKLLQDALEVDAETLVQVNEGYHMAQELAQTLEVASLMDAEKQERAVKLFCGEGRNSR